MSLNKRMRRSDGSMEFFEADDAKATGEPGPHTFLRGDNHHYRLPQYMGQYQQGFDYIEGDSVTYVDLVLHCNTAHTSPAAPEGALVGQNWTRMDNVLVVVSLTLAEYQALEVKLPDTVYLIVG